MLKFRLLNITLSRKFSTPVVSLPCRTAIEDPRNHNVNQEGLYYTVPPEDKKALFQYGGFPKPLEEQFKTFQESSVMIRKPALEIISGIKATRNLQHSPCFVLYGTSGVGKSVTLAHVIHYAYVSGWIILHAPWPSYWVRYFKEVSPSTTLPGMVDLPLDASSWLQHFKSQNENMLKQLKLETQKRYEWSSREVTEQGEPLINLADMGIARVKYSCDCVIAIVDELQSHATNKRCELLVAVDGANILYSDHSRILREDKSMVPSAKITLTSAFIKALHSTSWSNGARVITVDQLVMPYRTCSDIYPRTLLGYKAFADLEPLIPVEVQKYSDKEFTSCLSYYMDCKWLQHPGSLTEKGQKELEFLSGRNPYNLMRITAHL